MTPRLTGYAFTLFLALATAAGFAEAKGCLKGAAVGGAAGHVAGKHGVAGAAAGCVVGRHNAKKKTKQQEQSAQANTAASKGHSAAGAAK